MSSDVLCLAPGVQHAPVDDDVLLFDGSSIVRLSGAAALVVRAVDGRRTTSEIVDQLVEAHAVAAGRIDQDVHAVVGELVARGVVTRSPTPDEDRFQVPTYVAHVVDGEDVSLADLRDGRRYALDGTAARTVRHLLRLGTVSAVVEQLRRDYPDGGDIHEDVVSLVGQLTDAGLLVRHPADPTEVGSPPPG